MATASVYIYICQYLVKHSLFLSNLTNDLFIEQCVKTNNEILSCVWLSYVNTRIFNYRD